jgi:hypothetical protein
MDTEKFLLPRIFTVNAPTVLRIFPPLAEEIGLNQSIVLLQLDYLISIARENGKPIIRDGSFWTYQSLRQMKENWFGFWSPQTIGRACKSLDNQQLIFITDKYNAHDYDDTHWYALNPKGYGSLRSVTLHMVESNGTGLFQNGTGLFQNGTTIPETSSDIKEVVTREDEKYRELLNTVVRVCRFLDILSMKEEDYLDIDKLAEMDVTPELILVCYDRHRPDSWWWNHFWKGQKKAQFPTPADIVRTIGQAKAFLDEGMAISPAKDGKKARTETAKYLEENPLGEGDDWRL